MSDNLLTTYWQNVKYIFSNYAWIMENNPIITSISRLIEYCELILYFYFHAMDLTHVEIELKFPLLLSSEVITFLEKNASKWKSDVYQKDSYYLPAHRNFLDVYPVVERLRVRESVKWNSINYKHRHIVAWQNMNTCDEYETKVESIESIRKLLHALDFMEIIAVEKLRNTWNYDWVEICIDEVNELGSYIELEAKWEFKDAQIAKQHLYNVLEKIGAKVWEQDNEWYPYLLLKKHWMLKNQ